MHYIIETSADGTRTKVYEKPVPQSAERYVYIANAGSKPLIIGMNRAKRIARRADRRDQLTLLAALGTGLPRVHTHHQQLVRSRHRYYHEAHDELVKRTAA